MDPDKHTVGTPNNKWFVLAQYSRHIRRGFSMIDGGEQDTVAALDRTGKKVTTARLSPTTYYLLLTPHSSLLTPHFSLLTSHFSLLTSHSSLLTSPDRAQTYYLAARGDVAQHADVEGQLLVVPLHILGQTEQLLQDLGRGVGGGEGNLQDLHERLARARRELTPAHHEAHLTQSTGHASPLDGTYHGIRTDA